MFAIRLTNSMKRVVFLICYILFLLPLNAQYTDVINANKPGVAESPFSVGNGVYQFESALFFRNLGIQPTFSNPQSYGLDLLFRTSFFDEKLEFSSQFYLQNEKLTFQNISQWQLNQFGFGKFTIGAKYLIHEQKYTDKSKEIRSWKKRHAFDWKRAIPHVAVYLGFNTGFANEVHEEGFSPKLGIFLQNEITPYLNIVSNLIIDKIWLDSNEFLYNINITYNLDRNWSWMLEHSAGFSTYQNEFSYGVGAAYLFRKDIQFNASFKLLQEGLVKGFYTGIGISYRLDRHKDTQFLDKDGNVVDENGKPVDTIFGKLKKVFNKDAKTQTKTNKENVRTRPKRSRKGKKGEDEEASTTKKKGFFGRLFGGKKNKKGGKKKKKKKSKKKKTKEELEIEKLEKEIKEMEKDLDDNNKN